MLHSTIEGHHRELQGAALRIVILIAVAAAISGCTFNRGMVITPTTLGQKEKAVGLVTGDSEKDYFLFGIITYGDDSLRAALFDGLNSSKEPAQGINNAFAEKSCTWYPLISPLFFWRCNTRVTGMAVQYSDLGPTRVVPPEDSGSDSLSRASSGCPNGQELQNGHCAPLKPVGF